MEIQVNGKTYHDEKEAKKAIAKAKREEKKQAKENERISKLAYLDACKALNRILNALDRQKKEQKHNVVQTKPKWKEDYSVTGKPECKVTYSNANGYGEYLHFDVKLLSKLEGMEGDLAIKIEYDENETDWNVIGIYEGKITFIEIPSFLQADIDMFPHYKENK